ncbi:TPA: hypothetical protein ACRR5Z_002183, partial [Neisseria gonorrhoeae]
AGMTGFEIAVLSDGFRDYGVVGTQPNRHSHGSGNLGRGVWATVLSDKFPCGQVRIPACAGMTNFEITVLSGMTVRVFYCARPAPVNGGRIKNAV